MHASERESWWCRWRACDGSPQASCTHMLKSSSNLGSDTAVYFSIFPIPNFLPQPAWPVPFTGIGFDEAPGHSLRDPEGWSGPRRYLQVLLAKNAPGLYDTPIASPNVSSTDSQKIYQRLIHGIRGTGLCSSSSSLVLVISTGFLVMVVVVAVLSCCCCVRNIQYET